MELIKVKKGHEGNVAAVLFADEIKALARPVIGLATGSTPVRMYDYLIKRNQSGELDFSKVCSFNLDEYCGLPKVHPQSYYSFMQEHLFKYVNIDQRNVFFPNGNAVSLAEECSQYESMIQEAGGIDIQLLGIGHNGHIGFNEPSDIIAKETHVQVLADSTRTANARFFTSIEEVPTHAITMGIKTILNARKIMLLCCGEGKAEILKQALYGDVTPRVPASLLQLHPQLTVITDQNI